MNEQNQTMTENTAPEQYALDIAGLCVEYRTEDGVVKALNGLNLKIAKGKTLGLVGETGAGKTTTGLSVLGLVPSPPGKVTAGTILVEGENILTKSNKEMDKLRGKLVSMIFQDPMTSLNPVLKVEDQIAEVIERHESLGSKKSLEKAREILELVGIPGERGVEYPHQFSGGMKQRVVIAIALACSPQILIADEPTTALDVTIQAQVLEMMKELRGKYNMAMLMITHDLGIVAEICDDVSVIYAGRIVEHGNLVDIFDHPSHPYTIGLFGSLPDLDNPEAKLKPIRGLMPDPTDLPSGCPFSPRCDRAMDICTQIDPEVIHLNETHLVKCHLFTKDGGAKASPSIPTEAPHE